MSSPGDFEQRFTRLYRTTLTPLRRYLLRLLGDDAEAQDVAHDAYMRVYPKLEDDSAKQPEALLYTTARNLAYNRLRRRNISPISTAEIDPTHSAANEPGVVQQVIARQEWAQLEQAIADLPPGCRNVLLLRKLELLSHQAIADRLGISVSTVEKQHARALRLLRTALKDHEATTSSDQDNVPTKKGNAS
jgi:RNA polymerase sigma factor (sigma-70 family)